MLFGHDEGKNLKQLCDGEKDVICIAMGGTGADNPEDARKNLGLGAAAVEDVVPITKGGTGKTTALEALLALGGANIKKIWANASPTSEFKGQTLDDELAELPGNGSGVLIEYKQSTTLDPCRTLYVKTGGHDLLDHLTSPYGSNTIHMARGVTVNSNGIVFGGGVNKIVSNTSAGTGDNKLIIPLTIYIVKGVQ